MIGNEVYGYTCGRSHPSYSPRKAPCDWSRRPTKQANRKAHHTTSGSSIGIVQSSNSAGKNKLTPDGSVDRAAMSNCMDPDSTFIEYRSVEAGGWTSFVLQTRTRQSLSQALPIRFFSVVRMTSVVSSIAQTPSLAVCGTNSSDS